MISLLWLACRAPDCECTDTEVPVDSDVFETDAEVDTDEPGPTVGVERADVDECRGFCVLVDWPSRPGAKVTIEGQIDGFLADDVLDDRGHGRVCAGGGLSVGAQQFAIVVDTTLTRVDVTVHPFGYAYGLDKPLETLDYVPWVPLVDGLHDDPLLSRTEGAWDGFAVMMPSTVMFGDRRLLYYAGTADVEFALGVAWRDADTDPFTKYADNPILDADETGAVAGDWNYYAQNTPEALVVGDEVWMYYNGRMDEDEGNLSIGLATSPDGLSFTDIAANPVLSPSPDPTAWDHGGVAHPTVIARDGLYELWYASGALKVGYAISSDGRSFERYCGNPVFGGDPTSWDQGHVKAPEVMFDGGRYWMSYSGCGQGCYEVGWASSEDGLRWTTDTTPFLPTPAGMSWNSYGTQAAFIEVDGDDWTFWYSGSGAAHAAIGVATARAP